MPNISQPLNTGDVLILNGFRDLGIDPDISPHIGNECVVIKTCKSGLVQIKMRYNEKVVFSVPKHNLTPIQSKH